MENNKVQILCNKVTKYKILITYIILLQFSSILCVFIFLTPFYFYSLHFNTNICTVHAKHFQNRLVTLRVTHLREIFVPQHCTPTIIKPVWWEKDNHIGVAITQGFGEEIYAIYASFINLLDLKLEMLWFFSPHCATTSDFWVPPSPESHCNPRL